VKHHILPGDYTICLFPSVHGLMKHRILTGYNRSSLPTGIFYTTKLHLSSGTAKWHRFRRKPRSHRSYFSEFLAENETHSTRLHRATVESEFTPYPPPLFFGEIEEQLLPVGPRSLAASAIPWVCEHLRSSDNHTTPDISTIRTCYGCL